MEERVERLESLVALQDRTIEKLSDRLFEQQQQLRGLEKIIERLAGKVRSLDEDMEKSGPRDVPPPHYNG
jgi:SlyX protein